MTTLSRLPLTAPLLVRDRRDVLAIDFDDLVKYHGRASIGGVALAYRLMQAAFAALSPDTPPDRRAITILTAFPGLGAADAFEMVTRCRSENRYRVDTALDAPGAAAAATGRFFFQFTTPTGAIALGVREGVIPAEFIDLVRKNTALPLEGRDRARLEELKLLLAEQVLSLPEEALFAKLPTRCCPSGSGSARCWATPTTCGASWPVPARA